MTDLDFELMIAEQEKKECEAFSAKYLNDVDVNIIEVAGMNNYYCYVATKADALKLENCLNKKGLSNTHVHEAKEEQNKGLWVVQCTEKNRFVFIGGVYEKMVSTFEELCETVGIVPKNIHADCNQMVVQIKEARHAVKMREMMIKHLGGENIEFTQQYETTFLLRYTFPA